MVSGNGLHRGRGAQWSLVRGLNDCALAIVAFCICYHNLSGDRTISGFVLLKEAEDRSIILLLLNNSTLLRSE